MSENKRPFHTDDFILGAARLEGMLDGVERVSTEMLLRDMLVRDSAGAIAEGYFRGTLVLTGNGSDKTLAVTQGWGAQVVTPSGSYDTEYAVGGRDAGSLTIPDNTTGSDRGDTVQARVVRNDDNPVSVKFRSPVTPFAQGTTSVNTDRAWVLELAIKEGSSPTPPAPDAGYFEVYTYVVPNGFTTSSQATLTRNTANELYVSGANVAPFAGETGYLYIPASAFLPTASSWEFVQAETGDGLTTPGYLNQPSVGTSVIAEAPLIFPGLDTCQLTSVRFDYDGQAVPGTDSEKAWFQVVRYAWGGPPTHVSLRSSGVLRVTLTGDQQWTYGCDQNHTLDFSAYSYKIMVRGVQTGITGDRLYGARIAYTRPSGGFVP